MSTSTKAVLKPKRPLSGYNLFYRYKRNKVVEATDRNGANDDEHRNKAIIHAVLAALPGLEDVPPSSPLLKDLPPARLNEFRAAKIRSDMEGKLFPNENARSRQHIKVHGMGFVEMGQVMRQMWAQTDKFAKNVFCELAEVGRARYRRLVDEYKLSCARLKNVKGKSKKPNDGVNQPAENSALKSARTADQSEEVAPAGSFGATLAAAAAVDPIWTEAMAKAMASETSPNLQQKESRQRCERRVSLDPYFQASVLSEALSYGSGYLSEPLGFKTAMNPTANLASDTMQPQRRVSSTAAELDLCDDSLFEPLPIDSATRTTAIHSVTSKTSTGQGRRKSTGDIAPQPNWQAMMGSGSWSPKRSSGQGRRVSADVSSILNGSTGAVGAPTAAAMRNGSASSHYADANLEGLKTNLELHIQNLKDKIIQNNSRLPSEMHVFPDIGMIPRAQENKFGGKSRVEIGTLGNPQARPGRAVAASAKPSGGSGPARRGASVQGSVEFVDELAAAIDHHGIAFSENDRAAVRRAGRCAVPMSTSIDLKNHRARTA